MAKARQKSFGKGTREAFLIESAHWVMSRMGEVEHSSVGKEADDWHIVVHLELLSIGVKGPLQKYSLEGRMQ